MHEDNQQPESLQTRRGDLIMPTQDPSQVATATQKQKTAQLAPIKKAGFLAKVVLILITVACFAAMFQSDVLWSTYDTATRSNYQTIETWTPAWQIESIRSNDPITTSSYFWEKKIPLPTAIAHRGINLLLHVFAALLLLKCLEALKAPAAFAATLVFSTHPAVLQTLFWPGYRSEILGLILILCALLAGIQNNGTRGYIRTLFFTAFAGVIHPAAMAIPVVLIFVIIVQNQKLYPNTFNRVLPLICIALFIGVWTQDSSSQLLVSESKETSKALNHAAENMFFYIKQSVMPLNLDLFHPAKTNKNFNVGASISVLPFFLFVPFYILGIVNFRKPWARAGLLGITAFLFFCFNGITQDGKFLSGERAYENYGLYIALPAIIALMFCGIAQVSRLMGAAGKLLWIIGFSFFMIIHLAVTATFANTVGQPVKMWQSMTDQWPDSWIPKAAFIESVMATDNDLLGERELIDLLSSVLTAQPDLIEKRKLLARTYKDAGQNTNAVREYRRILRESKPDNEFLEEAARLYQKVGLRRDAGNARERKAL